MGNGGGGDGGGGGSLVGWIKIVFASELESELEEGDTVEKCDGEASEQSDFLEALAERISERPLTLPAEASDNLTSDACELHKEWKDSSSDESSSSGTTLSPHEE